MTTGNAFGSLRIALLYRQQCVSSYAQY